MEKYNVLKEEIEDMLAEEEGAVEEYVQLANDLYSASLSKSDAIKVFEIAKDEHRHSMVLKNILKKL